jgi:threonine dehydrogenase-like Zn-dependent dehydrogenase
MTIQAAFYTGHKTFTLEQKEAPAPGPGEVQIDVAYVGICGTDMHVFHGNMDARVGNHRVIGHEMSGTVAQVGEGVEGFAPGERVVVRPLAHCGECPACQAGFQHICHKLKFLGPRHRRRASGEVERPGLHAAQAASDMSLETAAMIEPLAVAVHDIRRARLQAGETALVIGGGPIGMLIAMVAKHVGANVILSEINANRLTMAARWASPASTRARATWRPR